MGKGSGKRQGGKVFKINILQLKMQGSYDFCSMKNKCLLSDTSLFLCCYICLFLKSIVMSYYKNIIAWVQIKFRPIHFFQILYNSLRLPQGVWQKMIFNSKSEHLRSLSWSETHKLLLTCFKCPSFHHAYSIFLENLPCLQHKVSSYFPYDPVPLAT